MMWVNFGRIVLGVYELVVVTMPYGCIMLNLAVAHLATLRTANDRLLLRLIRRKRKRRDGYHMLSCADALGKTGCELVATAVRKCRILFAGFADRMRNDSCFGKWMGERVNLEGKNRTGWIVGTRPTWYRCSTCPPKRNN